MKLPDRPEYDATEALNFSGAKELLKSGLHYQAYLAQDKEPTKALRIGSAMHKLALEGTAAFLAEYAIAPECDRRTSAGKAEYAAFATENAFKTILTAEEADLVKNTAEAARARIDALGLKIVATEQYLTVDYCGIPIKAGIDLIAWNAAGDTVLVDLKSTEDASPKGFLNSVRSYKYALQAHWYRTVWSLHSGNPIPPTFLFVAVEKQSPWATATYTVGPNLSAWAIADFEEAVKKYETCRALDSWTGYADEPQVLDVGAAPGAVQSITFA